MMYVGFPRLTEARAGADAVADRRGMPAAASPTGSPDDDAGHRARRWRPCSTRRCCGCAVPAQPDVLDRSGAGRQRCASTPRRRRRLRSTAAPRIIGQTRRARRRSRSSDDQWTVGRYLRDRPLYRFDFDDPARTIVYVSSTGGQIVLWTTATQRFWNWLGAVPHWIYPTALRSQVQLWSQIVIWASIVGAFLTVIGICARRRAVPARRAGKRLALSRPVLLASFDRAHLRHRHAHLGGQRPRSR